MRTYELVFVVDPRVTDEEVVELTGEYKQMLTGGGLTITREESWGRRKLAYSISKLTEGKYVVLYLASENGTRTLAEVEHRMNQNDKVLRYLSVRTDQDLKRAGKPLIPEPSAEGSAPGPAAEGATAPAAAPAAVPAPAPEGGRPGREE
jgi:small subunit ribosomal protein S6